MKTDAQTIILHVDTYRDMVLEGHAGQEGLFEMHKDAILRDARRAAEELGYTLEVNTSSAVRLEFADVQGAEDPDAVREAFKAGLDPKGVIGMEEQVLPRDRHQDRYTA